MSKINIFLLVVSALFICFSCNKGDVEPTINIDFSIELTYPDSCLITLTNTSNNYKKVVNWEYIDYSVDLDTIRYHDLYYGEEVLNWVLIDANENVKDRTLGIFIEDKSGVIHNERKVIPQSIVETCKANLSY